MPYPIEVEPSVRLALIEVQSLNGGICGKFRQYQIRGQGCGSIPLLNYIWDGVCELVFYFVSVIECLNQLRIDTGQVEKDL